MSSSKINITYTDGSGDTVRVMAVAENYAMVRKPQAMPFVVYFPDIEKKLQKSLNFVIMNAKMGETIDLSGFKSGFLLSATFEYQGQHSYTWSAQQKIMGLQDTIFPMRTAMRVRFFKTLDGAKRNLLKRCMKNQSTK